MVVVTFICSFRLSLTMLTTNSPVDSAFIDFYDSILKRPVVIGEGIAVRSVMNMCMSFDHRIIDGQMSGQFVGWIKSRLEGGTPASLKI